MSIKNTHHPVQHLRKIPEKQIQIAIEQYLGILEKRKLLVYIKNNSGGLKTENGSFIRFGKAGSPDFLLFLTGGQTIHLEIKTPKGRLSESQKRYQDKVKALGHQYMVVCNVNDLNKLLHN
ncbi:TPA: VRR-NUC domain-containing protein [Candidatus Poribacteria bacterium]|jgi:hypothetical protein|nr:VRR-NUC domain-containing protein [Candidatus Poribacteria bacterium]HIA70950.1 VRR-NUC domain-containing protein [Candidatus Poribacteria bacterium]HIB91627.1 VRR-NUC domain-containing protein [Candidatus Poribacteria bacterium]HIC00074.1 VRR-NUC domain-containing protein [Candidatus Poribacteria bacterium]HIM09964.1 VRR-NUC domain-containing protein [Candidatus Poribacteria bacterium]